MPIDRFKMLNVFLHISFSILLLILITGVQSTIEDVDYPMETYGLQRDCGQRYANYTRKDNSLAKFPWLVKLLYQDPMVSVCGGVLITDEYVLTTKDCIMTNKLSRVLIGEYDTTIDWKSLRIEWEDRAQSILVYRTLLHPHKNIGLIWLNNPARMSEWVQTICLPWCRHINLHKTGEIAGWSSYQPSTKTLTNSALHTNTVNLVSDLECIGHHGYDYRDICGNTQARNIECRGMQGGPLMMTEKFGNITRYVVVGVQAGERTPCEANDPISFINVTVHMDWVLDHIDAKYYSP